MGKQDRITVDVPPRLGEGLERLIAAGEFGTKAEYVRHLIRIDLPQRLAALDQDAGKPDPAPKP